MKLDKQFLIEQFEATVSQSTVPSPPLRFFDLVHLCGALLDALSADSLPGRVLSVLVSSAVGDLARHEPPYCITLYYTIVYYGILCNIILHYILLYHIVLPGEA